MTRNNGETTGRNPDGTFGHGNPGKPQRTRHKPEVFQTFPYYMSRALSDAMQNS